MRFGRPFEPDATAPRTAPADLRALALARSLGFHVVDLVPGLVERLRRGGKEIGDERPPGAGGA